MKPRIDGRTLYRDTSLEVSRLLSRWRDNYEPMEIARMLAAVAQAKGELWDWSRRECGESGSGELPV